MSLILDSEARVDHALKYPFTFNHVFIQFNHSLIPFTPEFYSKLVQVLNREAVSNVIYLHLNGQRLPDDNPNAKNKDIFMSKLVEYLSGAGSNVKFLALYNPAHLNRLNMKILMFDSNLARNISSLTLRYLPCDRIFLAVFLGYLQMRSNPLQTLCLEEKLPYREPEEQRLLCTFFLKLTAGYLSVRRLILVADLSTWTYSSMLLHRLNTTEFKVTYNGAFVASKAELSISLSDYMKSRQTNEFEIRLKLSSYKTYLPAADFDFLEKLAQAATSTIMP